MWKKGSFLFWGKTHRIVKSFRSVPTIHINEGRRRELMIWNVHYSFTCHLQSLCAWIVIDSSKSYWNFHSNAQIHFSNFTLASQINEISGSLLSLMDSRAWSYWADHYGGIELRLMEFLTVWLLGCFESASVQLYNFMWIVIGEILRQITEQLDKEINC